MITCCKDFFKLSWYEEPETCDLRLGNKNIYVTVSWQLETKLFLYHQERISGKKMKEDNQGIMIWLY